MVQDSELHRVVEKIQQDGSRRITTGHRRAPEDRPGDGVLTIHTQINSKGELDTDESYVDVFSQVLQQHLTDILEGYPNAFVGGNVMRFEHPFYPLIHRHQAIRDTLKSTLLSTKGQDHFRKLIKLLDSDLKTGIEEFERMQGFDTAVAFDRLWTIYVPGEVVIKTDEAHLEELWQLHGVHTCIYKNSPEYSVVIVAARQLQHTRSSLGYSRVQSIPFRPFSGARSIGALDLVPLKSRSGWQRLAETKIADGHRWWSLVSGTSPYHAIYNAIAFTDDKALFPQEPQDMYRTSLFYEYQRRLKVFKPIHIAGEIIVDQAAFTEANPNHVGALDEEFASIESLTDEQALLAPARVQGFSLDAKIWALFQVSSIQNIDWSARNTYSKLEIGPSKKHLLTSLITSQQQNMRDMDEKSLISDAGHGLTFMLHGGPGTGKTLTAQAMASHIKQPLYSTTSGELSKHGGLETNLRQALRWCRRWRAILLLDEADMFIAKRDISRDSLRNEMVTVFLQQIERFSGIIFFSTNHEVHDFDPAFMSRIHAIFHYKELDDGQKAKIWASHTSERNVQLSSEDIQQLVRRSSGLSGRDIRNVVQMAVLLREAPGWIMSVGSISRLIDFRAGKSQDEESGRSPMPQKLGEVELEIIQSEPKD